MKIGLALSSGSVRGLSHIGVLKVLEKNKIIWTLMVGCKIRAKSKFFLLNVLAKRIELINPLCFPLL